MKLNHLHLLGRVCNAPLALEPRYHAPILSYVQSRLGVNVTVIAAPLEAATLSQATARTSFPEVPENVAVIDICGPLVRRGGQMTPDCTVLTSYQQIEREYVEALNDKSKDAILMVFDTPGGEVGSLFDLSDLIFTNRGKKPVFGAVSEAAFSAGYALISACDRIFVSRTAGVGSIGLFTAHCDVSAMDEKIGLKVTYIYAGARKVDGNPHEPLSSEAEAVIQSEVDRTYDLFASTVARNRKLPIKMVKSTQAGLYFGSDSIENGLADEIGTVSDAVASILKQLGEKPLMASASPESLEINAAKEAPDNPEPALTQTPVQDASVPRSQEAIAMAKHEETDASAPEKKENAEEYSKKGKAEKPKAKPMDDEEDEAEPGPSDPNEEDEDEEPKKGKKMKSSIQSEPSAAAEIAFLCKVSNRTDLLADFITSGATVAEVRKALLAGQIEKQEAAGAIGHHVPALGGGNPVDRLDSMAKSRAAATGQSFSRAYADILRENPKLYVQYLDQKDAALGVKR